MKNIYPDIGLVISKFNIYLLTIFTLCFIAIPIFNPIYIFDNAHGYIEFTKNNNQWLKYIAQASMLIFSILWTIILSKYDSNISDSNKSNFNIAKQFGLLFTAMTSINYFIQLSTLRIAIDNNRLEEIESIIMTNPNSLILGINMLGWTLFFGISNLFFAFSLDVNTKIDQYLKFSLILQSIVSFLGALSFILNLTIFTFIVMNLFLGFTLFLSSIYIYKSFKLYNQYKEY